MEDETHPYTIVEIGPGRYPIHYMFHNNKIFQTIGKGSIYVGIDCNLIALQEELKRFYHKGYSVLGDVRDIPMADNSADQIWVMNVFGEFHNRPKRTVDGHMVTSLSSYDIFKELARVVKKEGSIYIGEILPPMYELLWLADGNYSGFGLEKKIHKGIAEVKPILEKMGAGWATLDILARAKDYVPFFMELSKT